MFFYNICRGLSRVAKITLFILALAKRKAEGTKICLPLAFPMFVKITIPLSVSQFQKIFIPLALPLPQSEIFFLPLPLPFPLFEKINLPLSLFLPEEGEGERGR